MKFILKGLLALLFAVPCFSQDMEVEDFMATIETNLFEVDKNTEYQVTSVVNGCAIGFIVVDNCSKLMYGTCVWGCDITIEDLYSESRDLWGNFRYQADNDSLMYISTHSVIPLHPLDWKRSGNKITLEFKNGRKTYYVRFTKRVILSGGTKI